MYCITILTITMNEETIAEIIRIQMQDLGLVANELHYQVAINYLLTHQNFPEINYVINTVRQMADNNNEASESDTEDEMPGLESTDSNEEQEEINIQNVQNNNVGNRERIVYFDEMVGNEIVGEDIKLVIKDIDAIPLMMYKSNNSCVKNTQCFICYGDFVNTDIIRILPCSHSYHRSCIDDYLTKKTHYCPYCNVSTGDYERLDNINDIEMS